MSPPSHHDHHHHHHAHKPHPLADESEEEGYSSHPSIYSASPVDSLLDGASSPKPSPSTVFSPSTDHIEYKSAPSTPYATDSDSDYGTAFHYEYASPAQPIHPARSSDMREISPLLLPPSVPVVQSFFSRSPSQATAGRPEIPRQMFRPPPSMNRSYGSLSSHPFHRAPMMVALGGGRGEITPDEIDSPSARDSESSQGGWGRVVRGICFVCCCLVVETETEGTEGRR